MTKSRTNSRYLLGRCTEWPATLVFLTLTLDSHPQFGCLTHAHNIQLLPRAELLPMALLDWLRRLAIGRS